MKNEYPINSTFTHNNVMYKVIDVSKPKKPLPCEDCAFYQSSSLDPKICDQFACASYERTDNTAVIFIKNDNKTDVNLS